MADLLQIGSDWLQSQRIAHLSQAAMYSRGTDQIEVNATVGKTDYEVDDSLGLRVKASIVDFLIAADELEIVGQKVKPLAGDRITIQQNGIEVIYEVMALGSEGVFRFSDSFGKTFRIHTRQVS